MKQSNQKQIIPIANDLASAYDDNLFIIHVITTENYEAHRDSLQDSPEFNDFSLDQEADSAAEYARRVAKQMIEETGVDIEPRGRVGDIADETLPEATSIAPQYLVIGGKRRTPTGKALFGSSAQKILLNADCPVVTVMTD